MKDSRSKNKKHILDDYDFFNVTKSRSVNIRENGKKSNEASSPSKQEISAKKLSLVTSDKLNDPKK